VGDTAVWGRGVGFEAFQTVVDVLTSSGMIRKITAGTLALNVGMIRIMQKTGMTWEASRKGQELVSGEPVDVVYFAKFCDA
jgi:RimJ/RimL family protein N-acetyltransferase